MSEHQVTQDRIDSIVKMGAQYEVCILSAIGCGAFHHDPDVIVDRFAQSISEHGRGGRYLFVIRPTASDKTRDRKASFKPFKVLQSEQESGTAVDASRSGGEAIPSPTLSELIVQLPLNLNSEGELIKKCNDLRGSALENEEKSETDPSEH